MQIAAKRPEFMLVRIQRGYSQREIARETGLSSSFISQLENGKRTVGPAASRKICMALGVELGEIFEIIT